MAILNRVRIVTTGVAGSPSYMNLFSSAVTVSPVVAHAAAAAFANGFKTAQVSTVTNTVEPDVAAVDTTTDSIVGVTSVPQVSYVGTGGPNLLPPATQIVVRWLTGAYAGGRQIRGRTFIPYIATVTQAPSGQLTAAAITNMNSAVNAYLAAIGPNGAVVYSRKNLGGFLVSSYSVWSQYGVMRSRRD